MLLLKYRGVRTRKMRGPEEGYADNTRGADGDDTVGAGRDAYHD